MEKERSVFRILSYGAIFCAEIVLPLVLAFIVPIWAACIYWPVALLGEWAEYRIRGKVAFLNMWVVGGNIALSRVAVHALSGKWWHAAGTGVVVFLALAWLHKVWCEAIGIPRSAKKNVVQQRGQREWESSTPISPTGEKLRAIGWSEIGMGGPVYCDYLFPDGSLLQGCGSSAVFTPDGRYFIAPVPSRGDWGLNILDTQKHVLYFSYTDVFREIDFVDNEFVAGSNAPTRFRIEELIARSTSDVLIDVVDLKLPQKVWERLQSLISPYNLPAAPMNAPVVELVRYLPASLATLKFPLSPLLDPELQLIVDGESSGFVLSQKYPQFVWRRDGAAFACSAKTLGEEAAFRYRLWQRGVGLSNISDPEPLRGMRPYVERVDAIALDSEALTVRCAMLHPELSHDSYGRIKFLYEESYEVEGKQFPSPLLYEKISLTGGASQLECEPLIHDRRLVFHVLERDEVLSRLVCRCSLDGTMLEGTWLIEHRISPDKRLVALVAYESKQGIPHRIAILNSETGAMTWVAESFADPWLMAFSNDELHFLYLIGRRQEYEGFHQRSEEESQSHVDEIPPPTDRAHSFMEYRKDSYLYYRRTSVKQLQGEWARDDDDRDQ